MVFRFAPDGTGEKGPWDYLQGREGYVQADASNVFDRIFNDEGSQATEVGCLAHARRKLHDLLESDVRVAYPLKLIAQLYQVEGLADRRGLKPTGAVGTAPATILEDHGSLPPVVAPYARGRIPGECAGKGMFLQPQSLGGTDSLPIRRRAAAGQQLTLCRPRHSQGCDIAYPSSKSEVWLWEDATTSSPDPTRGLITQPCSTA